MQQEHEMDLKAQLKHYRNLPNIDGEGFLFAFSGMDGETSHGANFVLTRHRTGFDFLIQTQFLHELRICYEQPGEILAATGDVFAAAFADRLLVLTFSAWHTLIGEVPQGASISLSRAKKKKESPLSLCSLTGARLAFARDDRRFALAYGNNPREARLRAKQGLQASLPDTIARRLAAYEQLPHLADDGDDRLLRKCFSVMKVNAMSPEGSFQQRWSTPDRVPHRDMWLWDSVFHALAMNKVNAQLSWEYLKTVLDQQSPDGMISHQFRPTGWRSAITQPPILAWGVWENYQTQPDKQNLAYAAPRLAGYLQWDRRNRDHNGNGLLAWFIEENHSCRSGESGMDNSQRFDEALQLDAVDFSSFAALDMDYLSRMYAELDDAANASYWQERALRLSSTIHQILWNEKQGFYFDRKMDGSFSAVEAVSGFLPLLLADFPQERLPHMVAALQDPTRFHTAMPVPSVAVNTPGFGTDMWRGAVWVNMNFLVAGGFEKQGRHDLAGDICTKTLAIVKKYYEQSGVIYEFYDALDQRPPFACDRKGSRQPPYNIRHKMDSIRDYHWSAALCLLMLLDKDS
jgi:hypothetical protein